MKFTIILVFGFIHLKTSWSYGSYRLRQLKCACNEEIFDYLHRNFSCYAKVINKDLTTGNSYGMIKKNIDKIWYNILVEYKYGTTYRTLVEIPKIEGCEVVNDFNKVANPILKAAFEFMLTMANEYAVLQRIFKDGCPLKVGEEFFAYNVTVDMNRIPPVFSPGDYRTTLQVYLGNADNLICNDTISTTVYSPFMGSFGKI